MKIINRLRNCALLSIFALMCGLTLSAKQPNVVFILADDLGIGGLNCFGTDFLETPNIDKLCADGMKFTNGIAAHPICMPSRMSILSGQYGPRTGGHRVADKYKKNAHLIKHVVPANSGLALEKITIAECFKEAGYNTAHYGKWHAGFYRPNLHPRYQGFDEAYACRGHYDVTKADPKIELPEGQDTSEYFTTKALKFMEQSKKEEKPFFLYLPYYLVHAPLETKKEYIDHFKEKLADREFVGRHANEKVPIIAAMTKHLDDCVARVLNKLKELELEEETIVIFTSDNGCFEPTFNGETRGQKGQVYEGGMRVPYIFKWMGKIKAGSESAERINHLDLYPTLLAMTNQQKPADYPLDGVDLSPLLYQKTNQLDSRQLYCYHPNYDVFNPRKKQWVYTWRNVIYDGDYKLIHDVEYDRFELFNLASDPQEKNNLSQSNPEKLSSLRNKLKTWMFDIGAPKIQPNPDYKPND